MESVMINCVTEKLANGISGRHEAGQPRDDGGVDDSRGWVQDVT